MVLSFLCNKTLVQFLTYLVTLVSFLHRIRPVVFFVPCTHWNALIPAAGRAHGRNSFFFLFLLFFLPLDGLTLSQL